MRQRAVVVENNTDGTWVKLDNPATNCGSCKGCVRLTGDEKPEETVLQVKNTIAAQVGDTIILEYPSRNLLQAVGILYGIPLLGLFLGYFLTLAITGIDATAGLGAVVGLGIFALLARAIARKLTNKIGLPNIVAISC